MSDFTIDTLAAAKIKSIVASSFYVDPVPSLGEIADVPENTLSHFRQAQHCGIVDEAELLKIATAEVQEVDKTLEYYLVINIFERVEYESTDLTLISGIEFAMPQHMRFALNGYVLSIQDDSFVLKGSRGIIRNLRSLQEG